MSRTSLIFYNAIFKGLVRSKLFTRNDASERDNCAFDCLVIYGIALDDVVDVPGIYLVTSLGMIIILINKTYKI